MNNQQMQMNQQQPVIFYPGQGQQPQQPQVVILPPNFGQQQPGYSPYQPPMPGYNPYQMPGFMPCPMPGYGFPPGAMPGMIGMKPGDAPKADKSGDMFIIALVGAALLMLAMIGGL